MVSEFPVRIVRDNTIENIKRNAKHSVWWGDVTGYPGESISDITGYPGESISDITGLHGVYQIINQPTPF